MDRRKVASGVGFPSEGNYGRSRLNRLTAGVRAGIEERLGEREKIDTLSKSLQGLILRFEAAAERILPSECERQIVEKALDCADEALVQGRDHLKNLRLTILRFISISRVRHTRRSRQYGAFPCCSPRGGGSSEMRRAECDELSSERVFRPLSG
jgi:hypothetical protein